MHHPTLTGCISWYVNYTSIEPSCLIYMAQKWESRQRGETAFSCLVSGARPPHPRETKGGSAEGRCQAQARRRLATAMSSAEAQAEAKAAPSSETKARQVGPPPQPSRGACPWAPGLAEGDGTQAQMGVAQRQPATSSTKGHLKAMSPEMARGQGLVQAA